MTSSVVSRVSEVRLGCLVAAGAAVLFAVTPLAGAEEAPPAPQRHFTDRAGVVPAAVAAELDGRLEQFERETSNQFVVWVDRAMPAGAALEDIAARWFKAWGIGLEGKDNGVLLLVFMDDRKLRIETGYGLEGALPDALCGLIIRNEIAPRFKQGDVAAGLRAGIEAVIAAARGEYKGSGRTLHDGRGGGSGFILVPIVVALIVLAVVANFIILARRGRRRWIYTGSGRQLAHGGGWGGWTGGGWSIGSSSSGGGGGFSGGGGSSGGGGASGSW